MNDIDILAILIYNDLMDILKEEQTSLCLEIELDSKLELFKLEMMRLFKDFSCN